MTIGGRPLVLLDLDGTLCDSAPGIIASVQTALAAAGMPVPDADYMRSFVGPPLTEVFDAYGVPADRIPAIIAAYRVEFEATGMWQSPPFPGIAEQLMLLRQAGCTLALATSKPERYAQPICERWGLDAHLDGIYGALADDRSSAKANVIARALQQLGERAGSRRVMVGDRRHDVEGAAAHGIACLGVDWGYADPDELAGAVAVVPRVDQLADAVLDQLQLT
ncbi:MAG: HAD hydrolase-like protein [Beutenbergiaceae bacterium]